MKIKETQEMLMDLVGAKISSYGFSRHGKEQLFLRDMSLGWCAAHLSFIRSIDCFDITLNVAVRFEKVEEMVFRASKQISKKAKRLTATIGLDVSNYTEGSRKRWHVDGETDLDETAQAISNYFSKYGLPYLEKFSDVETAFGVLKSETKEAWLHSPVHHMRAKRALAFAVVFFPDQVAKIAKSKSEYLNSRKDYGADDFAQFAKEVGIHQEN